MKIESIRTQGFRSLGDLTFNPNAFTVLVGPNNAGKSNIVDALGFLSDVYRYGGLHHAINVRGGFENIAHRQDGILCRDISFEVVVSASREEVVRFSENYLGPVQGERQRTNSRIQFTHRFTIHGQGDPLISEFYVEDEVVRLDLANDDPSLVLLVGRHRSQVDVAATQDPFLMSLALPLFEDLPQAERFIRRAARMKEGSLDLIGIRLIGASPLLIAFLEHLSGMRTFQFLPDMSRTPSSPTSAADLGHDGDNLTALVKNLQDQMPEAWSSVLGNMTSIMPDLEEIEVLQTTDKLWALYFQETGIGRHWTADEVSDGTIRALALFSSTYDLRTTLLAIEEPENSLHPWVLQEFVSACRAVSSAPKSKQILLTTHSPVLIDQLVPSDIVSVWNEHGRTMLRPLLDLEPGVEEPWADGKISLSGFLDSGLLRQAVPIPLG